MWAGVKHKFHLSDNSKSKIIHFIKIAISEVNSNFYSQVKTKDFRFQFILKILTNSIYSTEKQ